MVSPADPEALIIGGGVFGLSTALSLAKGKYSDSPSKILVIDRSATPPEKDAASSDINKIVRGDYSDATYAELALLALEKWMGDEEWKEHFHQSGIVAASRERHSHGEQYVSSSFENLVQLHKKGRSSAAPKMLDDDASYTQAMGVKAIDSTQQSVLATRPPFAYLNTTSGWAHSTGSMQALASRCRAAGVRFETGQVNALIRENDEIKGVELSDGRKIYSRGLVVLAAGSWSPAVLPELSSKLVATGQVLATIQLTREEAARYADIPVYIDMQTGFYMFPPNPDHIVKVALHHRGYTNPQPSLADPSQQTSLPRTGHFGGTLEENIPLEAVRELKEQLRMVFPDLAKKPFSSTRMCWYCDSEDCDFLISYHDRYKNLFLATAGSGHAFKFVPVIGDLCVQAIEGKLDPVLTEAWSYTRQRKEYKPDRGSSKLKALDVNSLARPEDLM